LPELNPRLNFGFLWYGLLPFFLWRRTGAPDSKCPHFFAAILNARCAIFGVEIFVPRILAIIHFLNFVFDPRLTAFFLAICDHPKRMPRDPFLPLIHGTELRLRPLPFLRRVRFTTPRRGRHFFAAILNARRADFMVVIFVPRILAIRHFLYFVLEPGAHAAAFRLAFFLTILITPVNL